MPTPLSNAIDRGTRIREEMAPWIEGEIIAQQEIDKFGTTIAVVERNESFGTVYDVIRGFVAGDGIGVSADMLDGSVAGLAKVLLKKLHGPR
jgi:hypothetical protein